MISYQDIHWESINFLKNHLYRRLASPLNNALGRLAIAQHVGQPSDTQEQFTRVEHSLELTLNLVKAWSALVHVKSGGMIRNYRRRPVAPDALPAWLVVYIQAHTALQLEHTRPLFVHPETFFESLILVCQIGRAVGNLKMLRLSDSHGERDGVWMRAVFEPPQAPYAGLKGILKNLNVDSPLDLDTIIQVHVAGDLLRLNGARFTLQNNTQTGEQALAALLPVVTAESPSPMLSVPVDEAMLTPGGGTSKNVYKLAEEMSDKLAAKESVTPPDTPVFTTTKELVDARASVGSNIESEIVPETEPHLAGSVLAQTPRDMAYPANQPGFDALDIIRHTISGPVLAPTPRLHDPESKPAPPETSDSAPESALLDEPAVDDTTPDTLIVPPPDFRRRLVTPPPAHLPPDEPATGPDADTSPPAPAGAAQSE